MTTETRGFNDLLMDLIGSNRPPEGRPVRNSFRWLLALMAPWKTVIDMAVDLHETDEQALKPESVSDDSSRCLTQFRSS